MSKLVLYHRPPSRSSRVAWLLEELEIPYESVILTYQSQKSEEHYKRHPLGLVPVLEVDGVPVFESGAIMMYILEKLGNGRLQPPLDSPKRAEFHKWLWFVEATLNAPALSELGAHTTVLPEEKRVPQILPLAMERALTRLAVLESAMSDGRTFLLGEEITLPDLMAGQSLHLAFQRLKVGKPEDFPNLRAYHQRLIARPACKRAFALSQE